MIKTDLIPEIKERIAALIVDYRESKPHCDYADIRIKVIEGSEAYAEDGKKKESCKDYGFSFGSRVIAGAQYRAPGYYGQTLGVSDLSKLDRVIKKGLDHAYAKAQANSAAKQKAVRSFDNFGKSLKDTTLAGINICRDEVSSLHTIDPRTVPLHEIITTTEDISKAVKGLSASIVYNLISASTTMIRELFCSSEGTVIDQEFAMTEGMAYVVAQTDGCVQELYDHIGDRRGWEVIADGRNAPRKNLMDFSIDLAKDALSLVKAKPMKATDKEVVVVTDPHYNSLLVHEIVGHPVELDRVLKYETAYAGRSWLFHDMEHTQIGKQIASPLITAYSDPSLPGYGHYKYDHEGTPGKKVVHIDNGILKGFMNSRQTAAILGVEPNGHYVATDASYVPLIRMSTTVFTKGDKNPEDIISEVEDGYYLTGARTPSISESRENFKITSMKVYKIKNGRLGELFRNGGITADTKNYLCNVDAVGSDFTIYPIPNCGKGQPMQTKRLGNGGPTMRSRAKITGYE